MEKIFKEIEEYFSLKIESYSLIGAGQCNEIYKLKLGANNYCLKVAKKDRPFDELNHISTEANILESMNNKEVKHIPRLLFKSNDYYIYEYVEGIPMDSIFSKLSEEEKIIVCNKIAYFHFQLSKINKDDAISIGITEYKPEQNKLGLDQHSIKNLSEEQINIIQEAHGIYSNSLNDSVIQLLHNDAHNKNILISNTDITFIDFGDMLLRDIHYDFYQYVFDYPKYWEVIVYKFEEFSGFKLNRERIVAISLLRNLRALLTDEDKKSILKLKIKYYSQFLKS